MRPSTLRHAARLFLAAFLTSAASALATIDARAEIQPPPLPPLPPPPSVSLRTLPQVPPLPPPPKPPVLPPAPPSSRPPPAVSTPNVLVPLPGQQGTGPSAGSGGSHTGSAGGSSASSRGATTGGGTATRTSGWPREPRVLRLSASRAWLTRTGPQARRRVVLRFVLGRPAVVEFIVIRVAPHCRRVGRFRVAGRAGVNRIPFRGRIRGHVLGPGTYRIRARALPSGQALTETRLVIFRRTPRRDELATARSSNTCRAAAAVAGGAGTTVGGATGGGSTPPGGHDGRRAQAGPADSGSGERSRARALGPGVLGVQFRRAADAVKQIHPLLFVLLGIAIALLALAATPARLVPNARVAAVLAYRRNAVAVAGAAALMTATVAHALL